MLTFLNLSCNNSPNKNTLARNSIDMDLLVMKITLQEVRLKPAAKMQFRGWREKLKELLINAFQYNKEITREERAQGK